MHARRGNIALAARNVALATSDIAFAARTIALATRNVALAASDTALAARNIALAARNVAFAARSIALAARNIALATRSVALATRDVALAASDVALATRNIALARLARVKYSGVCLLSPCGQREALSLRAGDRSRRCEVRLHRHFVLRPRDLPPQLQDAGLPEVIADFSGDDGELAPAEVTVSLQEEPREAHEGEQELVIFLRLAVRVGFLQHPVEHFARRPIPQQEEHHHVRPGRADAQVVRVDQIDVEA